MTCVTAFFALTTAGFGTYASVTNANKSDAQAAASGLAEQVKTSDAQVQQLTAERDDLKEQLEAAQSRIQELQATAATPAPDAITPTVSPAGTLKRSGSIKWDDGTKIDFDSDDPQWGQFDDNLLPEEYEVPQYVLTTGSYIRLGTNSAWLKLAPGVVADFATCSAATGYIPGDGARPIGVKNFKPGDQMCWRTNEGRIVTLSLKSRDGDRFTTDVAVYDA